MFELLFEGSFLLGSTFDDIKPIFFYLIVFSLMFANGFILFPSSQIILLGAGIVAAHQTQYSEVTTFFMLIIGNIIGNYLLYFVCRKYGFVFIHKFLVFFTYDLESHVTVATNLFKKFGGRIIFIGRNLPILHSIVSIPAGLLKYSFCKFIIYTIAGIVSWSSIFFFIGIRFSFDNLSKLKGYSQLFLFFTIFLIIATFLMYRKKWVKEIQKIQ